MELRIIIIVAVWAVVGAGAFWLYQRLDQRRRIRERLLQYALDRGPEPEPVPRDIPAGPVARMMFLAGFREPGAPAAFIVLTAALVVVGLGTAYYLQTSGLLTRSLRTAHQFPGGVLQLFEPIIVATPWIAFALLACLPWMAVRSARRRRVQSVETDMPVFFELLATLAESGLSFDAGLDRVVKSQPLDRPLSQELRTFQSETLSGRPRTSCFRRLARRLEISSLNVFISAVVQAEQTGAGIATVLRRQAMDLQNRRRERALEFAMALPIKRLFPMIICFLPGIFVAALGPSFFTLIQKTDMILHRSSFGR